MTDDVSRNSDYSRHADYGRASGKFGRMHAEEGHLVLPADSALYSTFMTWAGSAKIVFFAGLPGVGKSLYVQQLALLAQRRGRQVYLLQWDSSRLAFERPPYSDAFPENADGETHPAIRKAVGEWSRGAVQAWAEAHANDASILIGEVPLSGNRLVELVQRREDSAESTLGAATTHFCIPVPSLSVRAHIEAARHASIANPRNDKERYDAPPVVMYGTWYDMHHAAFQLGLVGEDSAEPAYDPDVYAKTYQHLLQHRNTTTLAVDMLLKPGGSVYALDNIAGDICADAETVASIMQRMRDMAWPEVEHLVNNWFRV